MFHYRSLADLNDAIVQNLHRLPDDVDLIVGVPRSGLLAAGMLALAANLPYADLDGFLEGRILGAGSTRRRKVAHRSAADARHALVIDDSLNLGDSIKRVRERIERQRPAARVTYCVAYGTRTSHPEVDIVMEAVPAPRMFQWNYMHHPLLARCCVDIDGVLCKDPTDAQNDDGPAYLDFLANAYALYVPTTKIGRLVTSRLERYRRPTELWLASRGIEYGELIMLDMPSARERREAGVHGSFKASVYRSSDSILFIESERRQAETIARDAGKPVLCVETQHLVQPGASLLTASQHVRNLPQRLALSANGPVAGIKRLAKRTLGLDLYDRLKTAAKTVRKRR